MVGNSLEFMVEEVAVMVARRGSARLKQLYLGKEDGLLLDGVTSWLGLGRGDAVAATPTA